MRVVSRLRLHPLSAAPRAAAAEASSGALRRRAAMRGAARVAVLLALASGLLGAMPAAGQLGAPGGGAGSQLLAPPRLPPVLPDGSPLPTLPPGAQEDILQRILGAAAGRAGAAAAAPRGTPAVVPPSPPWSVTAPPPPPASAEEPLSNLEAFFAARFDPAPDPPLRQFGYDAFRAPPPGTAAPPLGLLPDDYLLGRDDELILAFRGRARQTLTARIGRDGMLLLPDLPPVPAAGRTLRELRADLEARAQRDLGGSEVFVSIGQLRQIGVFVAGEVARPGIHALTALATVLDALAAAGGVRKTGSLRAIRIDGPDGASRTVDLYAVIAGAPGRPDLSLREGERVVVPPLGATVAIAGEVTRPGIYELPAGASGAPLAALLEIAGGTLRPAGNRFLVQRTDAQGRRSVAEVGLRDILRRGDAVRVVPGADVTVNQLRLAGHVAAPLTRASGGRDGLSLRALLADPRLIRPDPYPRLGVVWRADPATRVRRFLPFDLERVMRGQADMRLADADEVVVLGQADIQWLASPPVQRALRGEAAGEEGPGACPALVQLAVAARASPHRFAHARGAGFPDIGAPPCPSVFLDYPALLPFLLDQTVLLTGEARQPGLYPIVNDTGLDAVLAAAGGMTEAVDLSAVEFAREPVEQNAAIPLARLRLDLTSRNFAAVRLSPRDAVRLPRGFADRDLGPVTLLGEFQRPGVYDIRRGERLSEVIARAGGLTPQAYPYGAVFTRESVRQRQQEGFLRTARELEAALLQVAAGQAVAGSRGSPVDLGNAITAGRELANAIREARAAGRMVVEANPVVLAARPERDVLLEPGDLIVMPKRPNEVTVVGAVLNPGSLQFVSGWRAADYVRAAGGGQRFADTSRAFVVLPNGQSAPAGLSAWQQGGPPIPPGSLVVVPQDPSPYETWGFIRDLTQVLTQVSISGAALAVIAGQRRN
jgi:protein involved in polysaccharide export with SLBB domain